MDFRCIRALHSVGFAFQDDGWLEDGLLESLDMDMVPWETISHCISQNCVVMIYQRIEFSEQQLMLWIFFHFCSYHGFGVQCFVGNFFVACSHCFISTKRI